MKEKQVEQCLCNEIKKLGGIPYKFTSPGRRSVPDRLCVLPQGVVFFVECKATGEEPTAAQYRELDRLNDMEHWVTWVDSKTGVNKLIKKIKGILS